MRRQVVLLVVATTTVALLAFLVPLTVLLSTLARDRAVAEATREAQNLAALVVVAQEAQLSDALELLNEQHPRQIGLLLPSGRRIGAPYTGDARALELGRQGRSFTATAGEGREVYVAVTTAAGVAVIWTFVPESVLNRGVAAAVGVLVGLGLTLLVLTTVLADRLARGTVRPVRELARTALALGQGDLSARVTEGGPREVRAVGHALNLLAQRIGELLAAEREMVADLSHRLRTPLTALRLDVDAVQDPELRDRLGLDADALQRQVDQVIHEARRQVRQGVRSGCDAAAVVRERGVFWGVLFEDQQRRFGVAVPPGPCPVRADAEGLAAAVDALLQNALAYTPGGTAVQLTVTRNVDGRVMVTVTDEGPGISPGALGRGHSAAGSTGLGLDIARRTAEASGGELVLRSVPTGGAEVQLVLGAG